MCSFVQYCDVMKVMIIHKKIKLNLDWYKQYMKVMKFNHPSILKATLLEPNTEIISHLFNYIHISKFGY